MTGWKAYVGAAILLGSAVLYALDYVEIARALEAAGLALGVIGIRAKQERVTPGYEERLPGRRR